jgi:hypothetical protein
MRSKVLAHDMPPAKKTAAKKTVAKKTPVVKKTVAKKTPAAKKAPAERRPRSERVRPASEQHRRVVAAVQQMFRLCPLEAARWIWSRHGIGGSTQEILEARWIEQARRGPAYVVPPPPVEGDRPPTVEALVARVIRSAVEREAAESNSTVETIDFDFEEARRQAIAEGGAEVELLVKVRRAGRAEPLEMILGVMLPDEHEDGTETPWSVLGKTSWHLIACKHLLGPGGARPSFSTMPLYLWPATGLLDPQESCSVFTGEPPLPGFLGALVSHQSEEQRADEHAQNRKLNGERLTRQQSLDRARREAAARRLALTGDAGVTEEELAALVPTIDVDKDHITMIQNYDVIRLWEEPEDALLASLPPACIGLALFGCRPPGASPANALERAAFALRRALHGKPALEAQRAALSLAALGAAFLDQGEVMRVLGAMKLL